MRSDIVPDLTIICVYSEFIVLYFSGMLMYVMLSVWNMPVQSALKHKKLLYADNRDSIHCCYMYGHWSQGGDIVPDHHAHKAAADATGVVAVVWKIKEVVKDTCWWM